MKKLIEKIEKIKIHSLKWTKSVLFNLLKRKFDKKNLILIFSEGRGGSTWLMESIANSVNGLTIFEPFSENNFGYKNRLSDFEFPFYFTNRDQEKKLRAFVEDILKLNRPGGRALQFNSLKNIFFSKIVVVKFVNKNFILPWILDNIELKTKPILLIRNPIDIIISRSKYGYKNYISEKQAQYDKFFQFTDNHPISKHKPFLKTLNTNYELYIAEWCASVDYVIKNDDVKNKVNIIIYENFKNSPERVLKELLDKYHHSYEINTDNLIKESKSTKRLNNTKKQIPFFLDNHLIRFQSILDYFGIKLYKFV